VSGRLITVQRKWLQRHAGRLPGTFRAIFHRDVQRAPEAVARALVNSEPHQGRWRYAPKRAWRRHRRERKA